MNDYIKYLKKGAFAIALVLASFRCFAVSEAENQPMAEDERLLEFFKGLYHHEPGDSPARFALNQIAMRNSWRSFNILKGKWMATEEDRNEAREHLKRLKEQIDLGMNWPYKTPPSFKIPHANTAPVIDGDLNDSCWKQALSFQGSYPLSSVKKMDDGSVWKMMWDEKHLYVAAYFPDAKLISAPMPCRGDSLEIFLMPSKRMKKYWEVVVGCDGDLFDGFHCNNRYGGWASDHAAKMEGLKFKASKQKDGFTVEVAIPFSELPNYMLCNQPKPGETIHFALVRTDKNKKDGKVEFSSAFPLLYGGHNIFGHAKGKLTRETD